MWAKAGSDPYQTPVLGKQHGTLQRQVGAQMLGVDGSGIQSWLKQCDLWPNDFDFACEPQSPHTRMGMTTPRKVPRIKGKAPTAWTTLKDGWEQ